MATAPDLIAHWLAQTNDHALLVLDNDAVVTHALGSVEQTLGYAPEELVGKSLSALFTPEDRELRLDAHEIATATQAGRAHDDRWQLRGDGSRVWISGMLTAIVGDDGRRLGFVKVMRDRTDLRAEIDTLRNRVLSLARAEESAAAVLGTLAHELRNPLAPLATASQIVQRLLADDERARAPVQIIERQIALLKRLVDDLTDVARIETGKLQLAIATVELQSALRNAVEPRMTAAAERNVGVMMSLPAVPIDIEVDPQRFEQIVANLLNNAIKYTPVGGRIDVVATVEGSEVALHVRDTGIGIAADVLPRIFELFTQEREMSHSAGGGLGIGLALVKRLVDAHGGIVEVRSDGRNRGSEFTVRLPLRQPRP